MVIVGSERSVIKKYYSLEQVVGRCNPEAIVMYSIARKELFLTPYDSQSYPKSNTR